MSLTVVFQITGQESGEKVVFFPNPFNGLNTSVIAGWRRHCGLYQPSMCHLNFHREITMWLMQERSQERGLQPPPLVCQPKRRIEKIPRF